MTLLQLAAKNLSRDKHTYFAYYISSSVTIMLFYLFTAAAMHPELGQIENGSTLALTLFAGNVIIYLFAFLFIGYSSWAFLGSRGKQLGIYTILGMSPKQLKKMLFGENLLIGLCAILSGLLGGLLFSNLFFKLIRNIFGTLCFGMYLPVLPLCITFVLFISMFLILGLATPYWISRKKVLWFLTRDKAYANPIRVSPVKLLLAAGTLGLTVFLLRSDIGSSLGDFFTPAVFFCVIAAVFLLTPQLGALCTALKLRSPRHLKGIRLFADAESASAMEENRHMMSLNAVLLAMSFLAICALGAMQHNVTADVAQITPFAYTYVARPENHRAAQDIARLDGVLLQDPNIHKLQYDILCKKFTFGFLRESSFNEILSQKGRPAVQLGQGDLLILPGRADRAAGSATVHPEVQALFDRLGLAIGHTEAHTQIASTSGAYQEVYVVDDTTWDLLAALNDTPLYLESFTAYEDAAWLEHLDTARQLEQALEQDEANYDYTYSLMTLGGYYDTESLMRTLCTFVGFSISLIFLVASVSLIYFRLYTSLEREQKTYRAMYQLGFSRKEAFRSAAKKLSALLWLPFLVALAIMWAGILYINSLSTVSTLPASVQYSAIFLLVYFLFCQVVLRLYRNKLWALNDT